VTSGSAKFYSWVISRHISRGYEEVGRYSRLESTKRCLENPEFHWNCWTLSVFHLRFLQDCQANDSPASEES
jgi:hypothetical protein